MKHKRFYGPGEALGVEVHRGAKMCVTVHDGSHVVGSMIGKNITPAEAQSFVNSLIAEMIPKRIIIDNGSGFLSKSIASHISQRGIQVAPPSPYNPRTTPGERYVKKFNITGKRGKHVT
jgi:transposase InsO family protein